MSKYCHPEFGCDCLNHTNILTEADEITGGDRNADYGDPKDNHARTAGLWNAYFEAKRVGVDNPIYTLWVSREDVCYLNILQKIARDIHSPKHDNLVDIAGWARNIESIREP